MGYCIEKEEGSIKIKKENMKGLLQRLSDYFATGEDLRWCDSFKIENILLDVFDFVNTPKKERCEECTGVDCEDCKYYNKFSISDIWEECLRYGIIEEDEYYVIVDFYGEKLGDDDKFFKLIAPYCEDGYFQFLGEDGTRFRYIIRDGLFYEKYATVSWE